jgi:hypothetical protein
MNQLTNFEIIIYVLAVVLMIWTGYLVFFKAGRRK